jgi:hypothetical protein
VAGSNATYLPFKPPCGWSSNTLDALASVHTCIAGDIGSVISDTSLRQSQSETDNDRDGGWGIRKTADTFLSYIMYWPDTRANSRHVDRGISFTRTGFALDGFAGSDPG